MLISCKEADLKQIRAIAEETQTPLTVFAKVAQNDAHFSCESHHF